MARLQLPWKSAAIVLLASFNVVASVAAPTTARMVTYIDTKGVNWGAKPPEPICNVGPTAYNTVHVSFYLPSLNQAADFAFTVTNPNPIYGGAAFIEEMHEANVKVVLSVGGATELPISPDYFTKNEPVALANKLADMVVNLTLDGIDLDFEDDYSNANPALTGYGPMSSRKSGGGPGVAWLCTVSSTLRARLPRSKGYTISHAPQAPYFDLGYGKDGVHGLCGDDIDYYAVQFYNQGDNTAGVAAYTTADTLIKKEQIVPEHPSVVSPLDGSLTDIITANGIPASKVLIGKMVTAADGNNGYVPVAELAGFIAQAKTAFPGLGGVMGWQWGSDLKGAWIGQLVGTSANISGQ